MNEAVSKLEDEDPNFFENAPPGLKCDCSISLSDIYSLQQYVKKSLYYSSSNDDISEKVLLDDFASHFGYDSILYDAGNSGSGFLNGLYFPWQHLMLHEHGLVCHYLTFCKVIWVIHIDATHGTTYKDYQLFTLVVSHLQFVCIIPVAFLITNCSLHYNIEKWLLWLQNTGFPTPKKVVTDYVLAEI